MLKTYLGYHNCPPAFYARMIWLPHFSLKLIKFPSHELQAHSLSTRMTLGVIKTTLE